MGIGRDADSGQGEAKRTALICAVTWLLRLSRKALTGPSKHIWLGLLAIEEIRMIYAQTCCTYQACLGRERGEERRLGVYW